MSRDLIHFTSTFSIGDPVVIGDGNAVLMEHAPTTTGTLVELRYEPGVKPYVVRRDDDGRIQYHHAIGRPS